MNTENANVLLSSNLLDEIIKYIEESEERYDGEWGSSRSALELLRDNCMPDIYKQLLDIKNKSKHLFDIENPCYYNMLSKDPNIKERTKQRLTEIADLGMSEVALGQFGYKGIMSGLYIEKVWYYTDEEFKGYMDWVKEFIQNNKTT